MHKPYLLLPIGILTLFSYVITWLLVKFGLWKKSRHRKIWNLILILTFLVASVLGLLLAVQVNYKIEIPFVKTILIWHVDFGIAMSIVATLHLLWHWKYFLSIFKPENPSMEPQMDVFDIENPDLREMRILILLSGFILTTIQVLLVREFATVFQGNELMMGWTLGIWMFMTGLGTFAGKSYKASSKSISSIYKMIQWLCILPLLIFLVINTLKSHVFPPGIQVHPGLYILALIVLFLPLCLPAGFLYSMLVKRYQVGENDYVTVYGIEASGSFLGGITAGLILVQWFSIFQSLILLIVFVFSVLLINHQRKYYYITIIVFLLLYISTLIYSLDNRLKSFLFINQKVIQSKETVCGNITITENAGQLNFFENGSLFSCTDNLILNEENVHFAMLQHDCPKSVLLVSGGLSGMIPEILKYRTITNIDYVEINPRMIRMASALIPLPSDHRLHVNFDDPRRFIRHTQNKYDVVLFAIPDPMSLQINRMYTNEFITLLKEKLYSDAVILYNLSPSGNYLSNEKKMTAATLYHSLKKYFQHVDILPGERDYYIASDKALSENIGELALKRNILNKYVNSYYIDEQSLRQRAATIKNSLPPINIENTDQQPVTVFYFMLQFINQFDHHAWLFILIPCMILLLPLFFMKPVAVGMYITGITSISIELLLIFFFQVIYGNIYSAIGLIIAVFMGGLALGSFISRRIDLKKEHFILMHVLLVLYSIFIPFFCQMQKSIINGPVFLSVFFIATFIPSVIIGFQYAACTSVYSGETTGKASLMYAVDLMGSAFGIVLVTIVLLPILGMVNCFYILAGLNIMSVMLNLFR